jgi:hypothetical protein
MTGEKFSWRKMSLGAFIKLVIQFAYLVNSHQPLSSSDFPISSNCKSRKTCNKKNNKPRQCLRRAYKLHEKTTYKLSLQSLLV